MNSQEAASMSRTTFHSHRDETLHRDELEQLQIERLQSTLNRVYRNVAFYHAAFDAHCVHLERIRELGALRDLPFTTRDDLRRSYPYDMFAVPLRDIVRIHSTAGTGHPVVVGYTRNDLRNWTDCTARLLVAAGVTEHDVVQIALDYGISARAFGFHQGAERVGASVIPLSLASSVAKQVAIMKDFKTSVLFSTPGYAVSLAAGMEELAIHPERLQLRLAVLGGEQWGEPIRRQIEERLHILTMDSYGLTEIMAPGVAGECHLHDGLHINEDHVIVEVIDPRTLAPVPPGTEGELVFTTITKEGFPLVRYRTGDISSLDPSPCPCGRTFVRMARVTRRTDDLILFHGVGILPSQFEEILQAVEGAQPNYAIILDRQGTTDTLEIQVEVTENIPSLDEIKTLERLRRQIVTRVKAVLDIDAKVRFVEPRSFHKGGGGRVQVVDRRYV
jgi:phenylacetate-CoA ligase